MTHDILARYPPPYHLHGDLAVFPFAGLAPAFLIAGRYRAAVYGPGRTPLPPWPGADDLYRELAWVVALGPPWSPRAAFPRLWVDAPDPLPLELGWRYGFPKVPAKVEFVDGGGALSLRGACGEATLRVEARAVAPLPAAVFALAAVYGEFPNTGLRAGLRIAGARRASLLVVTAWDVPGSRRPLIGLRLQDAEVRLAAPEPSQRRAR